MPTPRPGCSSLQLGEIVYLPTLMAYLQRHAPLAQVRVRQLARGGYAEALEAGLADLAVGYLPHPRSSLRARRLFSGHFVCMVRAGHPMLDAPLTLESYSALRHVAGSRRAAREGLLTPALAALGLKNWEFRGPLLIGDTVHIEVEIIERRTTRDGQRYIVERRLALRRHDETVIQEGIAAALLRMPEEVP